MVAGSILFSVAEPVQVLPRRDLAPGFALDSAGGATITSEMTRGRITIYGFSTLDCGSGCGDDLESLRVVNQRLQASDALGELDWAIATVVVDPIADARELAEFAQANRIPVEGDRWQVLGGDRQAIERTVGLGFGRAVGDERTEPVLGFVLVDPAGVIRGDYRFATLSSDADKLVDHVEILANEIRRSSGVMGLAFEAAHLFQCYP